MDTLPPWPARRSAGATPQGYGGSGFVRDGLSRVASGRPQGADMTRRASRAVRFGAADPDAPVRWALERARAGDPNAVRYLFVRFADQVHAELVRRGLDADDAAESAVRAFTDLGTGIGCFRGEPASLPGWVAARADRLSDAA